MSKYISTWIELYLSLFTKYLKFEPTDATIWFVDSKSLTPIVTFWNDEEHSSIFSINNFSFEALFKYLNTTILLDIFTAMIEERPIIFVMRDIKECALII